MQGLLAAYMLCSGMHIWDANAPLEAEVHALHCFYAQGPGMPLL